MGICSNTRELAENYLLECRWWNLSSYHPWICLIFPILGIQAYVTRPGKIYQKKILHQAERSLEPRSLRPECWLKSSAYRKCCWTLLGSHITHPKNCHKVAKVILMKCREGTEELGSEAPSTLVLQTHYWQKETSVECISNVTCRTKGKCGAKRQWTAIWHTFLLTFFHAGCRHNTSWLQPLFLLIQWKEPGLINTDIPGLTSQ